MRLLTALDSGVGEELKAAVEYNTSFFFSDPVSQRGTARDNVGNAHPIRVLPRVASDQARCCRFCRSHVFCHW